VPAGQRVASLNSAAGQSCSLGERGSLTCAPTSGRRRRSRAEPAGVVTWSYGPGDRAGTLWFRHDRVVQGAWFERGAPNATYSITETLEAVSKGR